MPVGAWSSLEDSICVYNGLPFIKTEFEVDECLAVLGERKRICSSFAEKSPCTNKVTTRASPGRPLVFNMNADEVFLKFKIETTFFKYNFLRYVILHI